MDSYSLAIYAGLIFAVAGSALGVSSLLGRKRSSRVKEEPYECGVPQIGETRTEFNVRFFVVSMLFVLFDIETVLLAPYALDYLGLGVEGLVEVGVFLVVLGFGVLYAWRKGVLDWNVPLGVSPESVARHTEEKSAEAEPEPAHGH